MSGLADMLGFDTGQPPPPPPPPTGSGIASLLAGLFGATPDPTAYDNGLNAGAQYNHVTAQTQQALEGAYLDREKRMDAAAQRENEAADRASGQAFWQQLTDAQANDPSYVPPVSDMGAAYANNPKALLDAQEALYRSGMASGATPQDQRFRYGEAIKGEVRPQLYDVGGETVNMATDPNATFQTPAQHAHVVAEAALAGQRDRAGTNAAAVTDMSPAAAYNAAVRYNITGQLPPLGMNAAGLRSKILEYAANIGADSSWVPPELHGAATPPLPAATDLATNPAAFAAGRGALVEQTKRLAQVQGAEQTASKNLDLAAQQMSLADQTGVPMFNTIQNKIRANLLGDPTVAAYREALIGARNEYARVVSMQMGSAGMTEGARHEAQILFPDNLAPEQFSAAVSTAKQQMANRTQALHEATSGVQQSLHGIQAGAAPAPAAPAAASGWTKQTSPSTGAVRWINKATGETRNTAP